MSETIKLIEVLSEDGRVIQGEFILWECSPLDGDLKRLQLVVGDELFSADSDNISTP